jgi:heme/copper-type cytochrome/quinol oxidase subunit 2
VTNGKVDGPRRITAKLGDEVVFVVTADSSDEVHVHTYDVSVDVKPGRAATVRVEADIPGVFEIELEESKVLLTQLRVSP